MRLIATVPIQAHQKSMFHAPFKNVRQDYQLDGSAIMRIGELPTGQALQVTLGGFASVGGTQRSDGPRQVARARIVLLEGQTSAENGGVMRSSPAGRSRRS